MGALAAPRTRSATEPFAVALLLLTGVAILARHPLTRVIGTGADVGAGPVPAAAAPMRPSLPAASHVTIALQPAPTHAPRDPFRPLAGGSGSCAGRVHTVVAGDTLWTVAARASRTSDPGRITLAWQHLYAANRTALGSDPSLIEVGTRLCVPASL